MSGILLDTNAVSELRKPHMNAGFASWIERAEAAGQRFHLCTPVIGEIVRGAFARGLDNERRAAFEAWLDDLLVTFSVLSFDLAAAKAWGEIVAGLPKGRAVPVVDSYIAAIARHHGLTVVSRDRELALFHGVDAVNPWT